MTHEGRRRPRAAAALLLATSACLLIGVAVPALRAYLIIAAILFAAGAVVSAWRHRSTDVRKSGAARVTVTALALALTATALGSAHWTNSSTTFEAAATGVAAPTRALQTVSAAVPETQVLDVDELTTDSRLRPVVQKAADVQPVSDEASDSRIELAQGLGYEPQSGLTLDWANAVAQDLDGIEAVTVPLSGTDLPMTTKVAFMATEQGMGIVEMASSMIDPESAGMKIWQDGTLVKDVVVTTSDEAESDGTFHTVGWSINKFKKCLSDAGLVGVTIGLIAAACGVVCAATAGAGCLICAAGILGGNVGMVGTCAVKART